MAQVGLSLPTVTINNAAIKIVPNSFNFTEGFGTTNVRSQSAGAGQSEIVTTIDGETLISGFKLSLMPTKENIDLARSWKANAGANAATVTSNTFNRSFNNVSVVNDYDVNLGADTTIDLEFMGDPTV